MEGSILQWNQHFLPESDGDVLSRQPVVCLQITFQVFEDMAMEGFGIFDNTFVRYVATSMTSLVMEGGYRSLAQDSCGVFQTGYSLSGGDKGFIYHVINVLFAKIARGA